MSRLPVVGSRLPVAILTSKFLAVTACLSKRETDNREPATEIWRKCVGVEPTGPPEADPQDLKSWANTGPHALPH